MGKITFDRFDLGIDLRKGAAVSDANRLLQMKNAHVTTGMATAKRAGLVKVAELEPGTKGLFAAFGKLQTFYGGEGADVTHANALFQANKVLHPDGAVAVADVPFADVFNGKIYAAVKYANDTAKHHYLDGSATTHVADANCPHTGACIKMASKIFAVGAGDGDVVRYCATSAPRDWTTADDAGFLPTGLNSSGERSANALGKYQGKLAVLMRDSVQVWNMDPDPANMSLANTVENVGSSFAKSVATVSTDLAFLSDYGFRSITTLQMNENLADVDLGSPIDPLVRQALKYEHGTPRAWFFYGTGQYMCAIDNRLFVYTYSRTSKIAAWSEYFLASNVDAAAELGTQLYIRSGDVVYRLDSEASTDDGELYEVLIQLPYMNLKLPGHAKQIYGADVVIEGRCEFSVGFDVRNPDAFTPAIKVRGNSAGGGMLPVECVGTEFSLRFRNVDAKPFRLDSVTLYFHDLGPV